MDNIDEQVYEEMMDAAAYTLQVHQCVDHVMSCELTQVLMMQDDLRGYLNNNSTITS